MICKVSTRKIKVRAALSPQKDKNITPNAISKHVLVLWAASVIMVFLPCLFPSIILTYINVLASLASAGLVYQYNTCSAWSAMLV